jgi:hypothetical protein
MNPISDIAITIEFGQRRRVVAPETLAQALGCAEIRRSLLRLVLGKEGKGEERVQNGSENEFNNFQRNNYESFHSSFGSFERDRGSRGEEVIHTVESAAQRIAEALTTAFTDEKSSRFYRRVAEYVPLTVVRGALRSTFELTPREIWRSRAAYFTACVKPALGASRGNHA